MEKSKEGKNLPMGRAAELEAAKEALPAVEVKNRVIWVNPNFPELPFAVREGEATKLGMFLTPAPQEGEKTYPVEVGSRHGRSGIVGRVIFRDKDGRLYRDVDLKGSGYVELPFGVGSVLPISGAHGAYGILDNAAARWDADTAEYFTGKGIRAHRALAIVSLRELIDADGSRISIKEAKERGMIPGSSNPVVEVRAFGTKARLDEVRGGGNPRLRDAMALVAGELGKDPEKFGKEEYLRWLASTLGKNLGLIHKDGWFCQYLAGGHNTTLDGRFTDFDSYTDSISSGEVKKLFAAAYWEARGDKPDF